MCVFVCLWGHCVIVCVCVCLCLCVGSLCHCVCACVFVCGVIVCVCVCVYSQVVQAEAEPPHSVVAGSQRELELRFSTVCDYAKFSCDEEAVRFEDTMLYQTRVSQ